MCQWTVGPMANNYSGLTPRGSDIWKSWTRGGQVFPPPHHSSHPTLRDKFTQVRCFPWYVWHSAACPKAPSPRSTARPSFSFSRKLNWEQTSPSLARGSYSDWKHRENVDRLQKPRLLRPLHYVWHDRWSFTNLSPNEQTHHHPCHPCSCRLFFLIWFYLFGCAEF